MQTSPVFNCIYEKTGTLEYRYIALQGSSRSSKTYSTMQALILKVLTATSPIEVTVSSVSLPHLKQGALKDFMDICDSIGVMGRFKSNKTEHKYTFTDNGAYIEFKSFDSDKKARGSSRDILFVNEANTMPQPIFTQLNIRTRMQTIIDFNPSESSSYVYDIADGLIGSCFFVQSTYKHNPFLPPAQIAAIEMLQKTDPYLWEVFGLGLRGKITNLIFTEGQNWETVDRFPDIPPDAWIYGLDFGFDHPMGMLKAAYYNNVWWVEEIMYKRSVPASQISVTVKDAIGETTADVVCDAARPDAIADLRLLGLNAYSGKKDVEKGLYFMKGCIIKVHKESLNLIKELRNYKWEVNLDGVVKEPRKPVKFLDDLVDALRYVIYTHRHLRANNPIEIW